MANQINFSHHRSTDFVILESYEQLKHFSKCKYQMQYEKCEWKARAKSLNEFSLLKLNGVYWERTLLLL